MPITPSVLTWARVRAGYTLAAAEEAFRNIGAWETGDGAPSYPQLEQLADKFKVPVAVFFFPEPPDVPPIEETFRTLDPDRFEVIPPRVRLLLRKARSFQMGLEELNRGRNPAPRLITRDLSFSPRENIESIAATLRDYLGVSFEVQFAWRDHDTALSQWRQALGKVGVYVFKDQFRQDDYSGFCLYDDEFPIIYVNNTTTKTRQIFTLFHELAHLLFHTSGIDTPDDAYIEVISGDAKRIEVICNRLAAAFLVPEDKFEVAYAGRRPDEATAQELAAHFNVSRESIFRKFLDRDLITQEAYDAAAKLWKSQSQGGSGGNHYNNKIAYLGTDYIRLAFSRYYQNQINEDQLADYLDMKPKNLPALEERILERAS